MPETARQSAGEAYNVPAASILAGGYHHPLLRNLQAERHLTKDMLMYPIFITDEPDAEVRVTSLVGSLPRSSPSSWLWLTVRIATGAVRSLIELTGRDQVVARAEAMGH